MGLPSYLQSVKEKMDNGLSDEEICEKLQIKQNTLTRYKYKIKDFVGVDIEDTESIEDITEIQYYKDQVKYWKKKFNSAITQTSFESKFISLLEDNIDKYPYQSLKDFNFEKSSEEKEILHLLLSDWHMGETISSEELFGMNSYNIDIVKERVQKLYNAKRSILNKLSNYSYDTIHINILGDMVSGIIHEELIENGLNIVEQIVFGAEIVSDLIYKTSQHFKEVIVTGIIGNHGRTKKKPYYKQKYNNFDYLLYKFIETKCHNLENVKFEFPKSFFAIIQNWEWNILLMHGDGIQSFGGIPHYGIKRMDSNFSQALVTQKNIYPNYICMGHYHTTNSLEKMGGEIIMNGSLKGTDEFSLGKMFVGGNPSQLLFSMHPEHGITWRMTLNCK